MEIQADTLVSKLAKKLCAEYQILQIPDNMSKKALIEMKNEPNIHRTILEMRQTDTVLYGIGNAMEMAEKRTVSDEIYKFLQEKNAVAEALGYYFDAKGEIVYESRSFCLPWENIHNMDCAIAVAGGRNKAKSILSVSKTIKNCIIVIDEGVAKKIISLAGDNDMHYNGNGKN